MNRILKFTFICILFFTCLPSGISQEKKTSTNNRSIPGKSAIEKNDSLDRENFRKNLNALGIRPATLTKLGRNGITTFKDYRKLQQRQSLQDNISKRDYQKLKKLSLLSILSTDPNINQKLINKGKTSIRDLRALSSKDLMNIVGKDLDQEEVKVYRKKIEVLDRLVKREMVGKARKAREPDLGEATPTSQTEISADMVSFMGPDFGCIECPEEENLFSPAVYLLYLLDFVESSFGEDFNTLEKIDKRFYQIFEDLTVGDDLSFHNNYVKLTNQVLENLIAKLGGEDDLNKWPNADLAIINPAKFEIYDRFKMEEVPFTNIIISLYDALLRELGLNRDEVRFVKRGSVQFREQFAKRNGLGVRTLFGGGTYDYQLILNLIRTEDSEIDFDGFSEITQSLFIYFFTKTYEALEQETVTEIENEVSISFQQFYRQLFKEATDTVLFQLIDEIEVDSTLEGDDYDEAFDRALEETRSQARRCVELGEECPQNSSFNNNPLVPLKELFRRYSQTYQSPLNGLLDPINPVTSSPDDFVNQEWEKLLNSIAQERYLALVRDEFHPDTLNQDPLPPHIISRLAELDSIAGEFAQERIYSEEVFDQQMYRLAQLMFDSDHGDGFFGEVFDHSVQKAFAAISKAESGHLEKIRTNLITLALRDLQAADPNQFPIAGTLSSSVSPPSSENIEKLANYLFLDLTISESFQTTPLSFAINRIHTFVQSARMGITGDQISLDDFNKETWRWLRSYGTWHAAMMVSLYPENFLLANIKNLRQDETIAFDHFSELLENGDPDFAVKEYVDKIIPLSQMTPLDIMIHDKMIYILAQSNVNGNYFYSRVDQNQSWHAWKKLPISNINNKKFGPIITKTFGDNLYFFILSSTEDIPRNGTCNEFMDLSLFYQVFQIKGDDLFVSKVQNADEGPEEDNGTKDDGLSNWIESDLKFSFPTTIGFMQSSLMDYTSLLDFTISLEEDFVPDPNSFGDFIPGIVGQLLLFSSEICGNKKFQKESFYFENGKLVKGAISQPININLTNSGASALIDVAGEPSFGFPLLLKNGRSLYVYHSNNTADRDIIINQLYYKTFGGLGKTRNGNPIGAFKRGNTVYLHDEKYVYQFSIPTPNAATPEVTTIFSLENEDLLVSGVVEFEDDISILLYDYEKKKTFYKSLRLGNEQNLSFGRSKEDPKLLRSSLLDFDKDLEARLFENLNDYDKSKIYLEEFYFYIPLAIADVLNDDSKFEEADKWLQIIFEPNHQEEADRIRYPLIRSSSTVSNNIGIWLEDPFSPYELASPLHQLNHVKFTYVENLVDWADHLFVSDNPESVNRARELYELARTILNMDNWPEDGCALELHKFIAEAQSLPSITQNILAEPLGIIYNLPLQEREFYVVAESIISSGVPAAQKKHQLNQLINKKGEQKIQESNIKDLFNDGRFDTKRFADHQIADLINRSKDWNIDRIYSAAEEAVITELDESDLEAASRVDIGDEIFQLKPFCLPINPKISLLRWRIESNLRKIRTGRNFSGITRTLQPYATAVDPGNLLQSSQSGDLLDDLYVPEAPPPIFRYSFLIERAKYLVSLSQQLESYMLSTQEKADQEAYSYMRAKQEISLEKANVTLQNLRIKESNNSHELAKKQKEKTEAQRDYYQNLIDQGLNFYETAGLILQHAAVAHLHTAAALKQVATWGLGGIGDVGGALSATSSLSLTHASFERRAQEWTHQKDMANYDFDLAEIGIDLAMDRINIVNQEKNISELRLGFANDNVEFLNNKFTNKELYKWMSKNLRRLYREQLNLAISTAKTAQQALEFERQTNFDFIANDYWSNEKKGLLGAELLLRDIEKMEQFRLASSTRKKEITKSVSLASRAPALFQRFRQTGVLEYETLKAWFDRDFPGHYMRLIRDVSVNVLALTSATNEIHATLSNPGISRVMTGPPFEEDAVIYRLPESISLSSAINANGLFELRPDDPMLLPFEGSGVATTWRLEMPKGANSFDFNTIVDVILTIRYTALEDPSYRNKVLEEMEQDELGMVKVSAKRYFSLRNEFPDQWYHLHHPILGLPDSLYVDPTQQRWEGQGTMLPYSLSLDLKKSDFLPNEDNRRIRKISLAILPADGIELEEEDISFSASFFPNELAEKKNVSYLIRDLFASSEAFNGKKPYGSWAIKLDTLNRRLNTLLFPDPDSNSRPDISWIEDLFLIIEYNAQVHYNR